MSIRDRGTKKWNPFASMPEQYKMLREMYRDDEKIKKPIMDDDEIEIINNHLRESLQDCIPIRFKLNKNGFIEEFIGTVQQVDMLQRRIKVIDKKEYIYFIGFDDVVGTELH